ncbi:hypothetical protein TR13x_10125 [Caloranaerobacter sp. TR13]|uniref:REP-associated tyrosine transposase n=1 Tax=Caloranaerobacter sp. TR13 TaxID=1302151 RepID=UPI0006D41975|nr:transposase [Caloranaerobacter sp. TR13]KPU26426.1 hypothetical protein TR13x_10125 [Caloranaerobacter sp. TR13]
MKRYYEDNMCYFITTVTHNRKEIFNDKIACELFIVVVTYLKYIYDFNVYGFVIMPDHVHIIIHPCANKNISEIMKRIKGNFSRMYNKIYDNHGQIWQRKFYDNAIRNPNQIIKTIEYIHNNPIRSNLVNRVDEYVYSSYMYYYGEDKKFDLLIDKFEI